MNDDDDGFSFRQKKIEPGLNSIHSILRNTQKAPAMEMYICAGIVLSLHVAAIFHSSTHIFPTCRLNGLGFYFYTAF